ncbi:MAG: glycerophosphodiester phosphodiesterase [Gammaproteobacteria bacterium]|nr:glycerophosphodiester phosphodiesterase [Gammaproteobacteria bacterium]
MGEQWFDLQGHRGARGLWPENTLGGFERALSLGVHTLELDCALTRDGVVVISHDPQLNPDHTRDAAGRFLSGPGPLIHALDYAELATYDVGRIRPGTAYERAHPQQQPIDGERIPRLAELYALIERNAANSVHLNVEVKTFPLQPELTATPAVFTAALLAVVAASGMAARTTIQCFDWRVLNCVHHLAPGLATGALTDQQGADDTVQFERAAASPWLGGLDARGFGGSVPRLAQASGAGTWSPDYLDLGHAQVAEARALGLKVIPWTVNDPADMLRIIAMGVDGLITDRPDLALQVLRAQGPAVRVGGRV